MTKAEMKKSHDAMARFLKALCLSSDTKWNGSREPKAEANYQKALKLLKGAGFKYEPPKQGIL